MSPSQTLPLSSSEAEADTVPLLLQDYAITSNGFLPESLPLEKLPNLYYGPWESLIATLAPSLAEQTLRREVDELPVLSTDHLATEPEWRRACVILGFLTQAYIWGGDTAAEVLPPSLTVPFLSVSRHLGMPPVATYASLSLWNFRTASSPSSTGAGTADLTNPDALQSLHTFTSTPDESWFYTISIAMEARGAALIPLMLRALHTAHHHHAHSHRPHSHHHNDDDNNRTSILTHALHQLTGCITALGRLLDRMDERCRPGVFYHRIRPFLAGSTNMAAAGMPRGLFYAEGGDDDGDGDGDDGMARGKGKGRDRGEWRRLRGGSNGQSSLIQFLDVVLGVVHSARVVGASPSDNGGSEEEVKSSGREMSFHDEVRAYMPEPHRRFLRDVERRYPGGMRTVVAELVPGGLEGGGEDAGAPLSAEQRALREAFRTATRALAEFREKHLQMVARYIVVPSRQPSGSQGLNLATASSGLRFLSVGCGELTGTGGTPLLPFLKQTRDETLQAGGLKC